MEYIVIKNEGDQEKIIENLTEVIKKRVWDNVAHSKDRILSTVSGALDNVLPNFDYTFRDELFKVLVDSRKDGKPLDPDVLFDSVQRLRFTIENIKRDVDSVEIVLGELRLTGDSIEIKHLFDLLTSVQGKLQSCVDAIPKSLVEVTHEPR